MSSDLHRTATRARRLANGSNLDAYRESLADLGRAYLKAYPTAAALSVQGEPVAWQMPGTDSIITAELKAYRGVLAEQWTVPIYAAPAVPAVPDRSQIKRLATQMGLIPAAPAGWQPIETAPKDGSLFLCWVSAVRYGETDEGQQYQQDASQVDFCSWRDGPSDLPGHGYFDPCCGQIGDAQDVTHWMPLPAAPGAPQGDAAGNARAEPDPTAPPN